jgi:pimeloyl-ACP methyl ester carboxylesterase
MAEKSTTVRSSQPSGIRRLVGLVDRWFGPGTVAWAAQRLFFRARRARRPEREAAWLKTAIRFEVPGERPFVAWSWGEADRPAVLLVHGWEGRGAQLGAFVAPLLQAGLRVVTYDAPAHGESKGRESTIPEAAEALERIARLLGPLAGIVAHSLGAAATTLALSRGVRAARVVYVAPMVEVNEAVVRFSDFLGLSADARRAFAGRVESRAGASMASIEGTLLARKLTQPLLVLHDEDDREVPIADAEKLVAVWRGARLIRTRELGHRRILRESPRIEEAAKFLAAAAPRVIPLETAIDRELFDPSLRELPRAAWLGM